jgi:hypothetical protein
MVVKNSTRSTDASYSPWDTCWQGRTEREAARLGIYTYQAVKNFHSQTLDNEVRPYPVLDDVVVTVMNVLYPRVCVVVVVVCVVGNGRGTDDTGALVGNIMGEFVVVVGVATG